MSGTTISRRILRTPEAADYCGSSVSTFEKYRISGLGPVFVKIGGGRSVGYDIADLDRWLDSCRRHSTSDTGTAQAA